MVTAHLVPKRNSASTQKIQWGFVSFIALSDKTVSSMFAFLTKYVQILCRRCIYINKHYLYTVWAFFCIILLSFISNTHLTLYLKPNFLTWLINWMINVTEYTVFKLSFITEEFAFINTVFVANVILYYLHLKYKWYPSVGGTWL